MNAKSKSVAVLGANGFIGSTLCRYIRRACANEIALTPLTRRDFDLCVPDTWNNLADGVDCLVHAAALVNGEPSEIFTVNAGHAEALARFCNARRIGHIVYLSTGAVYGPADGPVPADAPTNPGNDYAVSKLQAEQNLARTFDGTLQVLRLYFPYGAGQKPPRLFPRLVERISNGEPITCNPGGGPQLSVVHVEDLCTALVNDFILGPRGAGTWNIASDQIVSIDEVGRRIAERLGRELQLRETGDGPDVLSTPYDRADGGRWRAFDVGDIV